MKYVIRGYLNTAEMTVVQQVDAMLSAYGVHTSAVDPEASWFGFEINLSKESEKSTLFDDLKPFVDQHTGLIDWHECTHGDEHTQPCVIAEEYRR